MKKINTIVKYVFISFMTCILSSTYGCKFFKPDLDPSKNAKIEWIYGGINGANSVEDTSQSGYSIKSFSFNGKTVKFEGYGEMWGNTHNKPEARNCLFFKEGNTYYGGFFEWGDPTRTSREINNITGKYKGWDPARLSKANEFAFCVTDKPGGKRSNFVFYKK